MKKTVFAAGALLLAATPAFAHVGVGTTASFSAGVAHPLSGIDHVAVMIAVGLWAGLKGGRALWIWPASCLAAMIMGALLGMAHVALPMVESGILASVIVLGLMVALAVDLPVAAGAAIIAMFALLHGHSHGLEASESLGGLAYIGGFALATAVLHGTGLALATSLQRKRLRPVVRLTGAACVVLGAALARGVIG